MLYTRKGDKGTSGLFGTKKRFSKQSPIYEALGTLDELTSLLGVCRAYASRGKWKINVASEVKNIQECLFIVQAELAGAPKSIAPERVHELERAIERIEAFLQVPRAFIIPGSTILSAILDYSRAVSRRTERRVVAVRKTRKISSQTLIYLNRISSALYALSRYAAQAEGKKESSPLY